MGLRLRLPCQPRLLFRAQGLVHRLCCPLEEAEGHREWSISVPCRLQPSAEVSDPRPPERKKLYKCGPALSFNRVGGRAWTVRPAHGPKGELSCPRAAIGAQSSRSNILLPAPAYLIQGFLRVRVFIICHFLGPCCLLPRVGSLIYSLDS